MIDVSGTPDPLLGSSVENAADETKRAPERTSTPASKAGIVAVASGSGIRRKFEALGAVVVDASETAETTAEVVTEAVESVSGERVIVLPNDENVFVAVSLLAARAPERVTVLRTGDQAEGLALAAAFDRDGTVEGNLVELRSLLDRVRTGQVAEATTAGQTLIGPFQKGQWIGFAGGELLVIEDDPVVAAAGVTEAVQGGGDLTAVIYCGADVDQDERVRLRAALDKLRLGARALIEDGGQRAHRYLVAVR